MIPWMKVDCTSHLGVQPLYELLMRGENYGVREAGHVISVPPFKIYMLGLPIY